MSSVHITQEQADEFAIGALEPEIAALVALHADACHECRELVDASRRAATSLLLAVPRRPASRKLKGRVLRSAGIGRPGLLGMAIRVATAGAGIAAVLVAVAAFTGMLSVRGQVHDLRDENTSLQSQIDDALSQKVEIASLTRRLSDEEQSSNDLRNAANGDRDLLLALLSPESQVFDVVSNSGSNAVGRLVWNEEQERVWFVATNLDKRPSNETYQIWVNSAGKFVSLGTFQPDDQGFVRYEASIPAGLESYDSAVVTIERAGGSPERSGPSVFVVSDLSSVKR